MPEVDGHREETGARGGVEGPRRDEAAADPRRQQHERAEEHERVGHQDDRGRRHVGEAFRRDADERRRVPVQHLRQHDVDPETADDARHGDDPRDALAVPVAELVDQGPRGDHVDRAQRLHRVQAYDVDEHDDDEQDGDRPRTAASPPRRRRRCQRRHGDVDGEEPQRTGDALDVGVGDPPRHEDRHDREDRRHRHEVDERRAHQSGDALPEPLRVGAWEPLVAAPVHRPARDEEQRHDLQAPRDERPRVAGGQRVTRRGDAVGPQHDEHEEVPEHHDEQRPRAHDVEREVPRAGLRRRRHGRQRREHPHGASSSDPSPACPTAHA